VRDYPISYTLLITDEKAICVTCLVTCWDFRTFKRL